MEIFLGQLPFWGLLGYVIYERRTAARMTRDGLRQLTEKRPLVPKDKPAQPDPPAAQELAEWPGDGHRPQRLPRTG